MLFPSIRQYCVDLTSHFDEIPADRKIILGKISDYIQDKLRRNEPIQLMYVCTHNSRRSHFGQVWAAVGAAFYGIQQVKTFSGGTEATAFNAHAIAALSRIGFEISASSQNTNPVYKVQFGENSFTQCFSKVYDDTSNPSSKFAAIMTCSDAEENCPFIPGVELRIGTTYDDPKAFDETEIQDLKYDERCRQIAIETLFVFSKVDVL